MRSVWKPILRFLHSLRSLYPKPPFWNPILHFLRKLCRKPPFWSPILRILRSLYHKAPLEPLIFPETGFQVLADDQLVEEDYFEDDFQAGQFYPVKIGDVYHDKYQVLGKLGFGSTSTVWLAHNLLDHSYVALKVYTQRASGNQHEFRNYEIIGKANPRHRGYKYVRTALDVFELDHALENGETVSHECLVQKPMWDTWDGMQRRHPTGRFNTYLLKAGLIQLFLALDYLHTECHIVHTDISAYNIMAELADKAVFEAFTRGEMESPSARKLIDGHHAVYKSRAFDLPKQFGDSALGDFGSAVNGDEPQTHDAQPDVYRSPEVMLETEWSYPVDIWNVGCMIWDLYLGRSLFHGKHPDGSGYITRSHLAEAIALLGPPPLELLNKGKRSSEYFTEDGMCTLVPI